MGISLLGRAERPFGPFPQAGVRTRRQGNIPSASLSSAPTLAAVKS